MNALIFSWSGSFRDDFADRAEEIAHIIDFVDDRGFEVGVVSEADLDDAKADVDARDVDFVVGAVENILEVLKSLAQKYDKTFFVSDVRAELSAVNQSGAFTVGYNSERLSADELGGVGPNYIVDDLEELEQILMLEAMDG